MPKPKTPKLSIDAVITSRSGNLVLIERLYPPLGYALVGGFVDVGETIKDAVRREVYEETNLLVTSLHMIGIYDDPARDTRWPDEQVISIAFTCRVAGGTMKAQESEVKRVIEIPFEEALEKDLVIDHKQILTDAMNGSLRTKK